jgi:uncharacterized HAD superfamily protein
MKPVLAVDFDDVLFPFMDRFVPHYNEKYGESFCMDDYFTFEFHEVWGGTSARAFECVSTFFHMPHDGIPPKEGSMQGVAALAERYELVIVTSREEDLRPQTQKWLDEHFPGAFRELHLCGTYTPDVTRRRTKVEVVEELDAVALIDDSVRHVSEVAAAGRRALLFGDYAWNRSGELPSGVQRYAGWQSIVESLVIAA